MTTTYSVIFYDDTHRYVISENACLEYALTLLSELGIKNPLINPPSSTSVPYYIWPLSKRILEKEVRKRMSGRIIEYRFPSRRDNSDAARKFRENYQRAKDEEDYDNYLTPDEFEHAIHRRMLYNELMDDFIEQASKKLQHWLSKFGYSFTSNTRIVVMKSY